jgi:hypothetical protein
MNFLHKDSADVARHAGLGYPKDRDKAICALIRLQKGFCAYSERYLKPLDSVELEHFDPRKKNTDADGFANWHAVIRWMNACKPRLIDKFEPLPEIESWTAHRVRYEHGFYVCDDHDLETRNLIEFLGVNRQEVFEERANHIARIRNMRQKVGDEMLMELLSESPEQLSFPTALEAELGIPAFDLIDRNLESEVAD